MSVNLTEYTFVNLTDYTLEFPVMTTERVMTIPRTGRVARVAQVRDPICDWDGFLNGVQLYKASIGEVEGLPEPQEGLIYIVSERVARAVPHRRDVAFPASYGELTSGELVGIKGLCFPSLEGSGA